MLVRISEKATIEVPEDVNLYLLSPSGSEKQIRDSIIEAFQMRLNGERSDYKKLVFVHSTEEEAIERIEKDLAEKGPNEVLFTAYFEMCGLLSAQGYPSIDAFDFKYLRH